MRSFMIYGYVLLGRLLAKEKSGIEIIGSIHSDHILYEAGNFPDD